ncbi:MAG TPA: ATP-binding protein [Anaeromyxobacter sp.]
MSAAPGPARAPASASSLQRRVYVLMGIGVAFPLVVIAAAGMFWMSSVDARIQEVRLGAVAAAAVHFDEELTRDLEVLQRLAANVAAVSKEEHAAVQRAVRDAHHLLRYREATFVLDREGRPVVEEPAGSIPADAPGLAQLVREIVQSGRPRLSGVLASARGPFVFEAVPIRDWQGQVAGVAGATFRPERRGFDRMLKNLIRGETGTGDLLDGSGNVVDSTERDRIGTRAPCARRMVELATEKKTRAVLCADCHAEYGVELRPEGHLTFAALASAPWGVALRQSKKVALPSEGVLPWYAVVWVLVGQCVLAGVFAWGAARSVTRPVAVLTDHAERIAGGELAWPIPELGTDEVGRLGKSLERMRQSLEDLIAHVAHANAELERRVADRTHELNEANVELRAREEDRSQLLRKIITAQEDERKRIARELHDETTQSLAVLAMGVEAAMEAARAGKMPRLDEVKALAVRTLEDVHRLILDLRPSVLDDLGLLSAIRWYGDRILAPRGVAVRCELGDLPRLPPEMETALFRMCQETLSNVARHAQASAVLVQVGADGGDDVLIDIEDDGRGFDAGEVAGREGRRPWGLLGIRERAEILGGTAKVESSPGSGTHVTIRIPLQARGPAAGAGGGTPTEVSAT